MFLVFEGWMNQATHKQSLLNESAGLRPPPMFHAAQPTGYVPMYNTPQVCHTCKCNFF